MHRGWGIDASGHGPDSRNPHEGRDSRPEQLRGTFSAPGYDDKTVACHVELLQEAGFIEAAVARSSREGCAVIADVDRLTWEGHDFLDSIRSDTIWSKTKAQLAQVAGSASLQVVKAVAVSLALKQFGL
jgi:hypothetical protein